jgi:hypothetical protein
MVPKQNPTKIWLIKSYFERSSLQNLIIDFNKTDIEDGIFKKI